MGVLLLRDGFAALCVEAGRLCRCGVDLVQGLIWWRGSVNGIDCGKLLWRF